jgi:lactose/L-arabinose transport system permease protein
MYTFPVALSSLMGLSVFNYGQGMTDVTIATMPIMLPVFSLQRHFISGMLGSALK